LENDKFKTFFSTATGFGTITVNKTQLTIDVTEGILEIDKLTLNGKNVKLAEPVQATADKRTVIRL